MKRVWKAKEVIKGWEGKPIKIQMSDDPFDEESKVEVGDMTIFGAMLAISNVQQIGGEILCKTLEDGSKLKALKKALKASMKSGLIELEGEVFKWLVYASEKVCPLAWRDNSNEVHDILTEGFKRENEPSKSKAKAEGKEKEDAAPAEEEG